MSLPAKECYPLVKVIYFTGSRWTVMVKEARNKLWETVLYGIRTETEAYKAADIEAFERGGTVWKDSFSKS